ncbi:MAG: ABC transporter ATP-binding protein [Bacteroidales bacterium]|jgi:ABC-type multidrug transport system ATPase subunit|nr:ABC transporter ATP-binding protein [Bacteroidales bacterium]
MSSIIAEHISKKFKSLALDDVSINVDSGELFGLIGPDGSGKTTLFRVLTTLMLPDKGKATVAGLDTVKDYKKIRQIIGYMPGRFSLYQDLSVEENLQFFATLFGTTIEKNYSFIKDIYSQIEPFKKRRAGALSGGMKQKLALSCALVHKPKVLFLDEPTTGVDPVSRYEFWMMLKRLKQDGVTIVASTPYMDEARLCDRICLMREGKTMAIDTPENMKKEYKWTLRAVMSDRSFALLHDLRDYKFCEYCFSFGEYQHIALRDGFTDEDLYSFLTGKGHLHISLLPLQPGIEDCFMDMTREM